MMTQACFLSISEKLFRHDLAIDPCFVPLDLVPLDRSGRRRGAVASAVQWPGFDGLEGQLRSGIVYGGRWQAPDSGGRREVGALVLRGGGARRVRALQEF